MRGATALILRKRSWKKFQSTHPLRGATALIEFMRTDHAISIHAPLAGCDYSAPFIWIDAAKYFNPRTPCGVRPAGGVHMPMLDPNFNPRTPCGVRPAGRDRRRAELGISIHAPLAGCDFTRALRADAERIFQSTHPLRGATELIAYAPSVDAISIHAPLAGCDKKPSPSPRRTFNFNPRTPCGVRLFGISELLHQLLFQSTHPLRGATPAAFLEYRR